MKLLFFGSFQHYSAYILQSLIGHPQCNVVGVVTTPPMPVGRKQIITKTPVHELADGHHIPVFTPNELGRIQGFAPTDYFVTAGYGKILPQDWLEYPKYGALNLHFSLLPAYRGANPAEWALMCGETETGITLMRMNQGLDQGDIITQSSLPITSTDTRETIYEKLYRLGAEKLPAWLQGDLSSTPQPTQSPTPYAALLKRDDGFIPWETIQKAQNNQPLTEEDFISPKIKKAFRFSHHQNQFLSRLPNALAGYPSLWTIVSTQKGDKRMKILSVKTDKHAFQLEWVQIEGQQPTLYNQIKNTILLK